MYMAPAAVFSMRTAAVFLCFVAPLRKNTVKKLNNYAEYQKIYGFFRQHALQ